MLLTSCVICLKVLDHIYQIVHLKGDNWWGCSLKVAKCLAHSVFFFSRWREHGHGGGIVRDFLQRFSYEGRLLLEGWRGRRRIILLMDSTTLLLFQLLKSFFLLARPVPQHRCLPLLSRAIFSRLLPIQICRSFKEPYPFLLNNLMSQLALVLLFYLYRYFWGHLFFIYLLFLIYYFETGQTGWNLVSHGGIGLLRIIGR